MSSTFLCPNFSSPFENKIGTEYEPCTLNGFQRSFQHHFSENQVIASTTTHQNVFTVQRIQPQAIFAE